VHWRRWDDAAPLAAQQQRARLGADLAVEAGLREALRPPRVEPEPGAQVGALDRQRHDAGRRPLALGCDKLPLKYCKTQSDPDGGSASVRPGPAWRRRAPPPVEHPAAARAAASLPQPFRQARREGHGGVLAAREARRRPLALLIAQKGIPCAGAHQPRRGAAPRNCERPDGLHGEHLDVQRAPHCSRRRAGQRGVAGVRKTTAVGCAAAQSPSQTRPGTATPTQAALASRCSTWQLSAAASARWASAARLEQLKCVSPQSSTQRRARSRGARAEHMEGACFLFSALYPSCSTAQQPRDASQPRCPA